MLIGNTDFIKLPIYIKGKVRDVYDLDNALLIVVTDRISAFDVVFDDLIPNKGKALNQIAEFWFDYMKDIINNHIITANVDEYSNYMPGNKEEWINELAKCKEQLRGRSMLVKKIEMLKSECIVRGYLEGSGLKDYNKTGKISGIELPKGMKQAEKLPEPIFTPSTKALEGHDENITFEQFQEIVGSELATKVKDISIKLYKKACAYAESKGIILADTKFEFGILDGELIIADEIFTPDSSRFWNKSDYQVGKSQKSFDKQYLRDYLEGINWDKQPPAPKLPEDIVKKTEQKYYMAYEFITGNKEYK